MERLKPFWGIAVAVIVVVGGVSDSSTLWKSGGDRMKDLVAENPFMISSITLAMALTVAIYWHKFVGLLGYYTNEYMHAQILKWGNSVKAFSIQDIAPNVGESFRVGISLQIPGEDRKIIEVYRSKSQRDTMITFAGGVRVSDESSSILDTANSKARKFVLNDVESKLISYGLQYRIVDNAQSADGKRLNTAHVLLPRYWNRDYKVIEFTDDVMRVMMGQRLAAITYSQNVAVLEAIENEKLSKIAESWSDRLRRMIVLR